MRCGITNTGSHWYSFFGGRLRITLFPYAQDKVEVSVSIRLRPNNWRSKHLFYKVWHVNEPPFEDYCNGIEK